MERGKAVKAGARAAWVTVRVQTARHDYLGCLEMPAGIHRLRDLLCDSRPALKLVDVTIDGDGRLEAHRVIDKAAILSLSFVGVASHVPQVRTASTRCAA